MNTKSSRQIGRLDTLRAIAVSIVVVFHLKPSFLPWGYIGVDMFFTLSGFLMCYLYLYRQDNEKLISMKTFLTRRFWRLFPPLIVVILMSLVVSILIFSPLHLLNTSESSAAAVFSVSNFFFHSQAGYFDTDAIVKPLLHTWSLGVEEQFYILFALALIITRWFSLVKTLTILTILSFGAWGLVIIGELSEAITSIHDEPFSSLFYLPQYRFFQFSIGGLAAYFMLSGYKGLHIWGYILFIAAASIASDKNSAHLSAPMITIGMALLMINASFLDVAAKNPLVRYLARISYQLYLVHWPIIVFWHYFTLSSFSWFAASICYILCIACADILYRATNWMRLA